jgi:hypothetical protein
MGCGEGNAAFCEEEVVDEEKRQDGCELLILARDRLIG